MVRIFNPFSWYWPSRRQIPARVPTDQILPVHDIDDRTATRTVLCWTLRFDEVLDADKIHAALARLLEIGDWKKLGGRLRQNESGRLELHVPQAFTADRPSVRYSRIDIGTDIDEHPLASQLPTATEDASIHPGPPTFLPLAVRREVPMTIDDYLHSEESQLTLHIVTFTDATLVSLVWPHTLSDCMGMQALMASWSLVLQGRETEVPPLLGIHEHPLAAVGIDEPNEPPLLPRLQGLPLVGFLLRYFWERWLQPELQIRTIYIPARTIASLKKDAISQLAGSSGPGSNGRVLDHSKAQATTPLPFLSDGDVLTAWIARATYRAMIPPGSARTLAIMNLFDARGRVPGVFDPSCAYLVNASFATFANVPPSHATDLPEIAAKVRAALAAQTTPAQVHMAVRELRKSLGSLVPLMFWPADSFMFVMSNWSRARFFENVDFGAAVKRPRGGLRRGYGPGRPVFSHAQLLVPERAARQSFQVMGRDAAGGYWLFGNLPSAAWEGIEGEVAALKGLGTIRLS